MNVASLCNECHHSWISPVIPIPSRRTLQSDYVPSTSELAQILSELREEEEELEAFDEEIGRLEDALYRMRSARKWLVHRMNQRKSAVSVLRRVPVEVWEMIFKCAGSLTEYALDFAESERWKPLSLPHALSWVCKDWKRMVDFIPAVWASIRISQLPTVEADLRPVLEEYLSKSSGRPLKISLLEHGPSHYNSIYYREPSRSKKHLSPLQKEVFLLLMKGSATRCEELELHLNYFDVSAPPKDLAFPILRSLTTDVATHPSNKMYSWLSQVLEQAPHLVFLSTQTLPFFHNFSHRHNLRRLEIHNAQEVSFSLPALLRDCDTLESLTVKRITLLSRNDFDMSDIYLSHLRTLHLTVLEDPSNMARLFDRLRATSLTDLSLIFHCQFDDPDDMDFDNELPISWPQSSFVQMLKRHSRTLTRLELEINRVDDQPMSDEFKLAEIAQAVPRLTYLKLGLDVLERRDLELAAQSISALMYQHPGLLPKLEEAVIYFQDSCGFVKKDAERVANQLLQVAESRTRESSVAVDDVTTLATMCVALGDMASDGGFDTDSEGWPDFDEEGNVREESWSALVSSRAMEERARALERVGTWCFFGKSKDFERKIADDESIYDS
ncbi:hypothetical protein AAF712_007313 [Marasmius tenuissimus]|uniref:F-box domain-containing protein n=1 Tax=Marasmius tenuissimus TaxID=585030 RepID=A0ABR2ZVG3_9AGAR